MEWPVAPVLRLGGGEVRDDREGLTLYNYIYIMTRLSDQTYSYCICSTEYINGQRDFRATLPDFISPAFICTQMKINGT